MDGQQLGITGRLMGSNRFLFYDVHAFCGIPISYSPEAGSRLDNNAGRPFVEPSLSNDNA